MHKASPKEIQNIQRINESENIILKRQIITHDKQTQITRYH